MPHKIVDIVVDKISFVDRSANQFEFFIVKDEDGADEVLTEQLNELVDKTNDEFDNIEFDNTNQAYAESIATLGKYYDDFPTDARRAISVLTAVGTTNDTTLTKEEKEEEEVMGEEEEVETVDNEKLEELEDKFNSYTERIEDSNEQINSLNEQVSDLTNTIEEMNEAQALKMKEKEEEIEDEPKEISVDELELTDELVSRVKKEKELYTEEEAINVAEDVLDETFNGK